MNVLHNGSNIPTFYILKAKPANIYMFKVNNKTLEKGMKHVQG